MEFTKKRDEQTSRVKRVLKLYSRMLLNNQIDWIKLKNAYNRTIKDNYAEYNIRKIVRLKSSQEMIEKEIIALYENNAITPDSVIKAEIELYDLAKENKSFTVNDKIIDRWGKRTGLEAPKVTVTQQIEGDMSHLLPDNTTGKLKAKQKQVTEGSRVSIDGDGDSD